MDPLSIILLLLLFILFSILIFGVLLMASFSTLSQANAALAAAIAEHAARDANSSGITVAESDQLLAETQANIAAVQAIP